MTTMNAVNYSRCVKYDKLRLLFPQMEHDAKQVMHAGLVQSAQHMLGWSADYARKHIRMQPYSDGKGGRGYYLQLSYKACDLVYTQPFSRANNLTEVEVKAYLCCKDNNFGNYFTFDDAIGTTQGTLNLFVHIPGTRSSKSKTGAPANRKLGSNKSGSQGGVYARRGEKPGLEVAVRKSRLRRVVQETTSTLEGIEGDGTDRHRWSALLKQVARVGFTEYENELQRRGIALKDYFEAFTTDEDIKERSAEYELPVVEYGAQIRQLDMFGGK